MSKKRKVFFRLIAVLLVVLVTSMGFPGTLFAASEQSAQAEVNLPTDNSISAVSSNNNTNTAASNNTTTANTKNTTNTGNINKDSSKLTAVAKKNEMMKELLNKKEAELRNLKVVNSPTDETLTDETPITDETPADVTPVDKTKTIKELVYKREANVKHFLMDDMTEEADIYSVPVHYEVDGQWKEIDNSMVNDEDDTVAGDSFTNKANDFKINIAKNTTSNKLVKIKKDKYEVSWNIENAEESTAKVTNDKNEELTKLTQEEKKKYVKNLSSNVLFPNIFQDVDLSYDINSNNLKENIILNKATGVNAFTFNLSTKNVIPQLTKNNTVVFYAYNKKDISEVFSFNAPVMYDAAGNFSKNITLKLAPNDNDYSLTITPDQEWINDSNRVYPITLDPTITIKLPSEIDNAIVKGGPNVADITFNGYSVNDLEIGNGTGTDGAEMSYLRFLLPSNLSDADIVTSAKLNLYDHTNTTIQINLYGVTSKWDLSGITYNNQPTHNPIVEDYKRLSSDKTEIVSFDITRLTKDWYAYGNNYGVLLKSTTDDTIGSGLARFYSTHTDKEIAKRPNITIDYINCTGLENYWSYHSQSVGRAGTIYTNDYNGNVIAVHDDVYLSKNKMPITLKHIYNSNDKYIDFGYGTGWRTNYNQTVKSVNGSTNLAYTDEDGTVHYFKLNSRSSTQYKDQSGLGLKLKKNTTDNTYTITDKKGNTLNFDTDRNGGSLKSIADSNGNTITINYDPNNHTLIRSISDGTRGITLTPIQDQTGSYLAVEDANKTITKFYYIDNQLRSITYPDGNISTYTYNNVTDNILLSVRNYDGSMAAIDYYCTSVNYYKYIYKVKKVQEYGSDGTTPGKSYEVTYGDNSTSFKDEKDSIQFYQFNNTGNVTNIQNADGSAQFIKYDTSSNALPNKIETKSEFQITVVNLVVDPGIERGGANWSEGIYGSNPAQETSTIYSGKVNSHTGIRSLKLKNNDGDIGPYFNQYIELTKGKTYTFSAYIKTANISNNSNHGAKLGIYYQGNSDNYICSNEINGTNNWQRVEITFSLPSDAVSNVVKLESSLRYETGTAYFDDFQLEEGDVCNRDNLVENSNFSNYDTLNNPYYWKKNNCTANDQVTIDNDNTHPHPSKLDNKVFIINGAATRVKSISKTIPVSAKQGDIFVFGSWAKANSVPITKDTRKRLFNLELKFSSSSTKYILNFNPGCKDWQYVTGVVKASTSSSSITITLNYSYNLNSASFDGIQLYKEKL
ncbi:MAG: DNRLRE domain-containing protein [Desulfitobacteriaceae bacterium]